MISQSAEGDAVTLGGIPEGGRVCTGQRVDAQALGLAASAQKLVRRLLFPHAPRPAVQRPVLPRVVSATPPSIVIAAPVFRGRRVVLNSISRLCFTAARAHDLTDMT